MKREVIGDIIYMRIETIETNKVSVNLKRPYTHAHPIFRYFPKMLICKMKKDSPLDLTSFMCLFMNTP